MRSAELATDPVGIARLRFEEHFKVDSPSGLAKQLSKLTLEHRLYVFIDYLNLITIENQLLLMDYLVTLKDCAFGNLVLVLVLDSLLITKYREKMYKHNLPINSFVKLDSFDHEGTKHIIEINNKLYNWHIPLDLSKKVFELTGGNPRLTKYVCKTLEDNSLEFIDKPSEMVKLDPLAMKLGLYAQYFWELELDHLKMLGMINAENKVFSQLVEIFLSRFSTSEVDNLVTGLSRKEKQVLSILILNKGRLVPRDKIDFLLNLNADNYSLWASYKAMDRLKKKVKEFYRIITVRDQGYRI